MVNVMAAVQVKKLANLGKAGGEGASWPLVIASILDALVMCIDTPTQKSSIL